MRRFSYVEKTAPEHIALLTEGESPIGIYSNSDLGAPDLLITDRRVVIIATEKLVSAPYNEIADLKITEEKQEATCIQVALKSTNSVRLPVLGRKGRGRDIFEFLRFLRRVSADAQTT